MMNETLKILVLVRHLLFQKTVMTWNGILFELKVPTHRLKIAMDESKKSEGSYDDTGDIKNENK
ncbi:MAG: hypothetical protein COB42_04265 [Sulfurimonas sp.]|nr:MAG: hypothetical protein COB42_04265 [Sulfurimonas sp.]